MTWIACTRCHHTPCACVYKPLERAPINVGPLTFKLSDSDVERIAQRVIELMRAERGCAE